MYLIDYKMSWKGENQDKLFAEEILEWLEINRQA
jgi:hypothetical protein